jgi:hypothetical protein
LKLTVYLIISSLDPTGNLNEVTDHDFTKKKHTFGSMGGIAERFLALSSTSPGPASGTKDISQINCHGQKPNFGKTFGEKFLHER